MQHMSVKNSLHRQALIPNALCIVVTLYEGHAISNQRQTGELFVICAG